jgi:hypothetical protein
MTQQPIKLQSKDNCGVCGSPLVYGTESIQSVCAYCGKSFNSPIYCPQGHYVCDSCHQREAVDILREVVKNSTSTDPMEILETVMAHPSVPMHGPEHHVIVPAAIVAAVRNAGYPIPEGAVEKAITRGKAVPGGWCGSHGACGAGIGVGIAVSVLLGATPLTGKQRSLANKATSYALSKMVDDNPRCCKRAGRNAIKAAVEFLKDELNITLNAGNTGKCLYPGRNQQCPKEHCIYYSE